jgi:hypothetical protein
MVAFSQFLLVWTSYVTILSDVWNKHSCNAVKSIIVLTILLNAYVRNPHCIKLSCLLPAVTVPLPFLLFMTDAYREQAQLFCRLFLLYQQTQESCCLRQSWGLHPFSPAVLPSCDSSALVKYWCLLYLGNKYGCESDSRKLQRPEQLMTRYPDRSSGDTAWATSEGQTQPRTDMWHSHPACIS